MTRYLVAPDADRFPLAERDHAAAAEHGLEIRAIRGHAVDEFRRLAPDAVGALVWGGHYGVEVFDALPALRVLARCGAGYDNIDLVEARRRGIAVTYCPGLFDSAVAEHTVAMVFALARKLAASDRAIRDGAWPSAADLVPMGRVEGRTLGLVGLGRIARRVLEIATALRMRVVAYDPYLSDVPPGVRVVASLPELLREADVVSLHVPSVPATRHLIGPAELAAMKPTAFLVNTGRGELVDGDALARALQEGTIAGAALDVFDPEPIPADHPILSAPHTLLTPHSAAFDDEALAAVRRQAIADAIAVIEGREPAFPVEVERTSA
jgi:phosphoglycerate dehydrogenase-like enzyme